MGSLHSTARAPASSHVKLFFESFKSLSVVTPSLIFSEDALHRHILCTSTLLLELLPGGSFLKQNEYLSSVEIWGLIRLVAGGWWPGLGNGKWPEGEISRLYF